MAEIRPATADDIPEIVALGARAHAESPRYSQYTYAPARVEATAAALLGVPWGIVLIARTEALVGMFAGMVTPHGWCEASMATDAVVFVEPGHRGGLVFSRLLLAFERRAAELGADEVALGLSSGTRVDGVLQVYQRAGYELCGHQLRKRL